MSINLKAGCFNATSCEIIPKENCLNNGKPWIIGDTFCDYDESCISRSINEATCIKIKLVELCNNFSIILTAN